MRRAIFITGIAGSGKSTICKELQKLGYEAHDIEDIEGMFEMYRKGTREIFDDYDNADPDKIKNSEWLCDVSKLKELIHKQQKELAFYCGVASNMDDIIPLFDKVIVLKASPEILRKRLENREGTDDIGNTEASRDTVLGWKDWWEEDMSDNGAVTHEADLDPESIAHQILDLVL